MTCTRCGLPADPVKHTNVNVVNPFGRVDWTLCTDCSTGLMTWAAVRQHEFSAAAEPEGRVNAELLHACRMALDAAVPYPAITDVLRTAIVNALKP